MLSRLRCLNQLTSALARSPAAVLLGPRQCGKTTLARQFAQGLTVSNSVESNPANPNVIGPVTFFDCENPADVLRLAHAMTVLEPLRGLVVIDEAQRLPDLFPVLRVLIDRPDSPAKFLLLGSASPQIIKGSSESLAGRVALLELSGFDITEVGADRWRDLWVRGGFPRSMLADSDHDSFAWRQDFIRLFLERDLPALGLRLPTPALQRFWTMIAHYHGQLWSTAEISRSMGISQATVRDYLDVLTHAFIVRQLPPWFENIGKRQVKAPKVFLRDSGLLHGLLGLDSWTSLTSHPKLGASWEGFVIEHLIHLSGTRDAYFWATHGGAELDLLLFHHGRRIGFEVKFQDAPTTTKSMHIALSDLKLDRLFVVYPGPVRIPLTENIECLPFTEIAAEVS